MTLNKNSSLRDLVIVGSGPAGLTAAIYAARANMSPLVLEGSQPGGQLITTTEVENFPGFSKGIMGPELMDNMKEQAKRFDAEFKYNKVTDCNLSVYPFHLALDTEEEIKAKSLILAMGSSPKFLGIESEKKYLGYGVSTCATCDGFFYKGKKVVVIGGGDTAMEEALFLSKLVNKVTIIHRREKYRASKIMLNKAQSNSKIFFEVNSVVFDILGDGKNVTGVSVKHKNSEIKTFFCEGVFIAIGHVPNVEPFSKYIELDKNGCIITKKSTMETNIRGVFACGDVQDSYYRQAVTSAGTGCMASLDAERFLQHL